MHTYAQVAPEVTNLLSAARAHFINSIQGIFLGKHFHPFLNLYVKLISSTETS